MSNTKTTIMMPDTIERFIAEGFDRLNVDGATPAQTAEAFQEIINLLAILVSGHHGPEMDDPTYFRQMEENAHAWGHARRVTPEAQAVGKAFLAFLKDAVESPAFVLLQENTRRGYESDAFDPGGGLKDQRQDGDA
ncbi:hypothetical protein [Rhizobium sp. BK418]|uniref:hypothetical protein n=1 Tax=Rhizobium sp. BK418 TaxID=2512120 RepID=UPI001053F3F6|nr:hypothetical protein [Rhizobium sp. BK418]TCS04620.1 hypothetical protein EV281_103295 [Rhizobium sp. BK418]